MKSFSVSNVSKQQETSWGLNAALGLSFVLCFVIFTYLGVLTIFEKFIINKITLEHEQVMWEIVKTNFGFDDDYILDIEYENAQLKIQKIVDNLPHTILPKNYPIEILVMNNDEINAFAAPGGKIILTTGLLDALRSENSIVFVLGHEIGHFIKKDHLYEFIRILSASLFSIFTQSNNSLLTEFILTIDSKDSRAREINADKWGIETLIAKYGHAGGYAEFFELISDNVDNSFTEKFSSHPSVQTRMANIIKLINANNVAEKVTAPLLY